MVGYVALVRGINVGGAKQIGMPALSSMFQEWGFRDVRTLLRSGNVVFRSDAPLGTDAAATIEADFEHSAGFPARWIVLTAEQLATIAVANPLRDRPDPARALIGFVPWGADLRHLEAPDPDDLAPEELVVGEHAVYQWCPDGISKSTVKPAYWKALGDVPITARNLNTVNKLRAMLAE